MEEFFELGGCGVAVGEVCAVLFFYDEGGYCSDAVWVFFVDVVGLDVVLLGEVFYVLVLPGGFHLLAGCAPGGCVDMECRNRRFRCRSFFCSSEGSCGE